MANPTVAQKVPFAMIPRDADGAAVEVSAFPAALTEISWAPSADSNVEVVDDFHVFLSRETPGDASVTVTAKNVNGDALSKTSAVVTFDAVTPVVADLDVQVGAPVPR